MALMVSGIVCGLPGAATAEDISGSEEAFLVDDVQVSPSGDPSDLGSYPFDPDLVASPAELAIASGLAGGGNYAAVYQSGEGNVANVYQRGAGLAVIHSQTGRGNWSDISQAGLNSRVQLHQVGSGLAIGIHQTGLDTAISVWQSN